MEYFFDDERRISYDILDANMEYFFDDERRISYDILDANLENKKILRTLQLEDTFKSTKREKKILGLSGYGVPEISFPGDVIPIKNFTGSKKDKKLTNQDDKGIRIEDNNKEDNNEDESEEDKNKEDNNEEDNNEEDENEEDNNQEAENNGDENKEAENNGDENKEEIEEAKEREDLIFDCEKEEYINLDNLDIEECKRRYNIPDFKTLKPTTMTLVALIQGNINLRAAFALLPTSKVDLPPVRRNSKKIKLPVHPIPGSIISMRFANDTRGTVKTTSTDQFKNSVEVDISIKEKNLCMKISKCKIQICGAKTIEMGREGVDHILEKLKKLQSDLEYIRMNNENYLKVKEFILREACGQKYDYVFQRAMQIGKTRFIYSETLWDNMLKSSSELSEVIPETIDRRIAEFFIRYLDDYSRYSEIVKFFEWFERLDYIITPNLELVQIDKAMVNFNYSIGFCVNQYYLHLNIDFINGFYSKYENSLDHQVTVKLPYKFVGRPKQWSKKKNNKTCHTFLVYKSGTVTQSGPNEELMEKPYYLFMYTILSMRELIEK